MPARRGQCYDARAALLSGGTHSPGPERRFAIAFGRVLIGPSGRGKLLAVRQPVALDLPGLGLVEDVLREAVRLRGKGLLPTRGHGRVRLLEGGLQGGELATLSASRLASCTAAWYSD